MSELDWCDLGLGNWGLYQRKNGLRFSMDAVLLSHFVKPTPHAQILDIGTGTGIIAFLLSAHHPTTRILGVDVQPQLVRNACLSRDRNGIDPAFVDFRVNDMRQPDPELARSFDWVVCNPPFFKPDSGAINPDTELSLARHELTLNLDDLFRAAAHHLRFRGRFALIHRADRLADVIHAAHRHHLTPSRLQPIYARPGEAAKLFLLETIHGGKQALVLETPRVIYDENGDYNPDVIAMYEGAC